MGGNQTNLYEEQKKAVESGKISFDLNIYLIGENIKPLFELLKIETKKEDGNLFSYWNYFFTEGNYENQLKEAQKIFLEKQNDFINDPLKKKFKEVLLINYKKKEINKINEIFDIFCMKKIFYAHLLSFS